MLSQQRVGRLALTAASCPLLHGFVVWARAFTVRHTFLLSSVVPCGFDCEFILTISRMTASSGVCSKSKYADEVYS